MATNKHPYLTTAATAPDIPTQPTVADPNENHPFPRSKLPRELADMIYSNALASGNTSLLRLSRASNRAASPFLFKAGIFRINVREIRKRILLPKTRGQHTDFNLDPESGDSRRNRQPWIRGGVHRNRCPAALAPFMGPSVRRGYVLHHAPRP